MCQGHEDDLLILQRKLKVLKLSSESTQYHENESSFPAKVSNVMSGQIKTEFFVLHVYTCLSHNFAFYLIECILKISQKYLMSSTCLHARTQEKPSGPCDGYPRRRTFRLFWWFRK